MKQVIKVFSTRTGRIQFIEAVQYLSNSSYTPPAECSPLAPVQIARQVTEEEEEQQDQDNIYQEMMRMKYQEMQRKRKREGSGPIANRYASTIRAKQSGSQQSAIADMRRQLDDIHLRNSKVNNEAIHASSVTQQQQEQQQQKEQQQMPNERDENDTLRNFQYRMQTLQRQLENQNVSSKHSGGRPAQHNSFNQTNDSGGSGLLNTIRSKLKW
jgi:hypothetical protein